MKFKKGETARKLQRHDVVWLDTRRAKRSRCPEYALFQLAPGESALWSRQSNSIGVSPALCELLIERHDEDPRGLDRERTVSRYDDGINMCHTSRQHFVNRVVRALWVVVKMGYE